MISDELRDKILAAIDIEKVVSEDVTLKRSGANYRGLCPFHTDKTPSLYVSKAKGIWKCFVCGEGGDAIKWVAKINDISYYEAARMLAKQANIEFPENQLTDEELLLQRERESVRVVMNAAQEHFVGNISSCEEAREYLEKRQISDETVKKYGLGYSREFNDLTKALREKGYKDEYIVKAGLAYWSEVGKVKDFFYKRIMFPFRDNVGRVIGYSARDITNNQMSKYKNTGETEFYHKGNELYGLYEARTEIGKQGKVYIVEGQVDVLALSQCGVCNVVAGSGTAFTKEARSKLARWTKDVVFIYDGDKAGVGAAMKHLPAFITEGFKVRCISLPDGQDPDDLCKRLKEETYSYLKANERTYVEFLCKVLLRDNDDTYKRNDNVKAILKIVALENDEVVVSSFIRTIAAYSEYDETSVSKMLSEIEKPERPTEFKDGIYGIEEAANFIDKEERVVKLTNDFDKFFAKISEKKPWVFYYGTPGIDDIQNLSMISRKEGEKTWTAERFEVHDPVMDINRRKESDDIVMMREMFKFGMSVDAVISNEVHGFVTAYCWTYGNKIKNENLSTEIKNEFIMRCAEIIALTPETMRTINIAAWSSSLGIKETQMNKLIKPFVDEQKSRNKLQKENADIYSSILEIDTEKIPDYVIDNEKFSMMLKQYNYYPVLNKKGMEVCYMFKTAQNSYKRVGDFYMEPLLHIYSKEAEDNRRIIKLNSLQTGKSSYVEWPSKVFCKLPTLKEMLICEGGYNFVNGRNEDYDQVWTCMSHEFKKCTELKVFGQQPEDCFCFANGIFHRVDNEWKFENTDQLGLVSHEDNIFYSPAFSIVNAGVRSDDDKYEQDRWLIYKDIPTKDRISFQEWASLMNEVYRINNNGKWAIIYSIMCAFRSDIYPIKRIFTSVFYLGPTMSGKTQIAVSTRSLYINPLAQCFNLNSGTDAAFFSILERFRDVPQIFEEYNDEMISDTKFQGLKAVCYDGDGKQKRKSASSNDIETSKVNAPIILLGQEAPQKDDNALSNRVVLCEVPKRDEVNEEHAKHIFERLKNYENIGLSYLLIDILKLRPIVRAKYKEVLHQCNKELQERVEREKGRSGDQTRLIETVSLFLAMCRILTDYAPELRLPFSYEEFLDLAVQKVKWQVELLVKTDKLSRFFNIWDTLIDEGKVKIGRDFRIETREKVKTTDGEKHFDEPVEVVYFNISNIHQLYCKGMISGEKPLTRTTLEINLKSSPAYIGQVASFRFNWQEVEMVTGTEAFPDSKSVSKIATSVISEKTKNTSAVVLNYTIMKNMMHIDFNRNEKVFYNGTEEGNKNEENPQGELPF